MTSEELTQELNKRNITLKTIEEYIKFEDECVQKGFTFKSLLEAREKQIAKKPVGKWYLKACCKCDGVVYEEEYKMEYNYCPNCGQKQNWSEIKEYDK